jgi:hypothetical protein
MMHRIDDLIVQDGKIVLSELPFSDGQHVSVVVDASQTSISRKSISEVRSILKNSVTRFDDPFEPMIPEDNWETDK